MQKWISCKKFFHRFIKFHVLQKKALLTFLRGWQPRRVQMRSAGQPHHPLKVLGKTQVTFGIHLGGFCGLNNNNQIQHFLLGSCRETTEKHFLLLVLLPPENATPTGGHTHAKRKKKLLSPRRSRKHKQQQLCSFLLMLLFNSAAAKQNNTLLCSVYLHFQGTVHRPWPHFHECINYSIWLPVVPVPTATSSGHGHTKPCPYLFNIALFFLLFLSLTGWCCPLSYCCCLHGRRKNLRSRGPRFENPERAPPKASADEAAWRGHTRGGMFSHQNPERCFLCKFIRDPRTELFAKPKTLPWATDWVFKMANFCCCSFEITVCPVFAAGRMDRTVSLAHAAIVCGCQTKVVQSLTAAEMRTR